ncbi:MAG: hypothetical protein R2695_03870 [Acidimicrobiales bacterium]
MSIPAENLIGELNNGWNMATAMLMRTSGWRSDPVRWAVSTTSGADTLIEEARKLGVIDDPILRQKLMRIYILETCQSIVSMRTRPR